MEIKIQCGCGTRYKFDVEPVNGRMPVKVQCPSCTADGTPSANEIIRQSIGAGAIDGATAPVVSTPRVPTAPPLPPIAPTRPALAVAAPPPSAQAYADNANRTLLERSTFFVKERVALLKLTDTYDILDPATGQTIGVAKEEPPTWAKWLRLLGKKQMMPTAVNIYEQEGMPPVVSIRRGITIIRSKITVTAGDGQPLGYFKSKLFSIGGGFNVFDNQNQQVAEVKGNWKGWDFKFVNKNGREIGTVTKKWAGLGKELFTSADNYIISLTDLNGNSPAAAALLLAAGLAIDVVYKEAE